MTVHIPPASDCPDIPPFLDRRQNLTETIPVPWDKPKTQLPAEQDTAVVQAKAVAEAMLDDTADADPMKIKSRVQAAMNLCDERDWQTAKTEFAYASICCEFRYGRRTTRVASTAAIDQPRTEQVPPRDLLRHARVAEARMSAISRTPAAWHACLVLIVGMLLRQPNSLPMSRRPSRRRSLTRSPRPPASAFMMPMKVPRRMTFARRRIRRMPRARPVSRATVQREVEAPSEGVKRKAKTAAKNRSAKVEREAREKDKQAIMQETLEATAARAQASEAELALRNANDWNSDDETRKADALEEMATANANLTSK